MSAFQKWQSENLSGHTSIKCPSRSPSVALVPRKVEWVLNVQEGSDALKDLPPVSFHNNHVSALTDFDPASERRISKAWEQVYHLLKGDIPVPFGMVIPP